jgi:hypothetical protein
VVAYVHARKSFCHNPDCPDIGKPGRAATARGYIFVNLPESLAFTRACDQTRDSRQPCVFAPCRTIKSVKKTLFTHYANPGYQETDLPHQAGCAF